MPDNTMAAMPTETQHAIQEEFRSAQEAFFAQAHVCMNETARKEAARRQEMVGVLANNWSEKRHTMTKEEYEYLRVDLRYFNAERKMKGLPEHHWGLEDVARRVNAAKNEIPKPADFCDSEWRAMSDKDKDFARAICTENDRMDMEKGLPPKYYPARPDTSPEGQPAAGGPDTVHMTVPAPLNALQSDNRNAVQHPQHAHQHDTSKKSASGQLANPLPKTAAPPSDVIDLVSPISPPAAMRVNEDSFASRSTQARNAQDAAVDSQIELDQRRQQHTTTPTKVSKPNTFHTPPTPQRSSGSSRKSTPAAAGQATNTTPRAPFRSKSGAPYDELLAKAAANSREHHSHGTFQTTRGNHVTYGEMLAQAKVDGKAYEAYTYTSKRTQAFQAYQLEAVEEQINRDNQMKHTPPETPQQGSAQIVHDAPQANPPKLASTITGTAKRFLQEQADWIQTQRSGNVASQGQAAPGPSHQMPSVPRIGMWNSPDLTPEFANVQPAQYDQVATMPSSYPPQGTFTDGQQYGQLAQQVQSNARHQTPQPMQQLQRMQQSPQKAKEKEKLRNSSNEIDRQLFEQMQRRQVQSQQVQEPRPAHVRSGHLKKSLESMQAAQACTQRMQRAQGSLQQTKLTQAQMAETAKAQMRDVHDQRRRNLKRQYQNPVTVPAGAINTADPSAANSSDFQHPGQMAQMQQSSIDHQQLQMGYQQGMQFNRPQTQVEMMGYMPSLKMNFPQQSNMSYQQQPQMGHRQQAPFMDFHQNPQMYFPQQPNMGFQQPVQSMSPQHQLVDQQSAQFMDHQQQLSQMSNQQQPQMGYQLPQMNDQGMAQIMGDQQPQMDFQQYQGMNHQQLAYFMGDQQQQPQPDLLQQPQWTEEQLRQDLFPELM